MSDKIHDLLYKPVPPSSLAESPSSHLRFPLEIDTSGAFVEIVSTDSSDSSAIWKRKQKDTLPSIFPSNKTNHRHNTDSGRYSDTNDCSNIRFTSKGDLIVRSPGSLDRLDIISNTSSSVSSVKSERKAKPAGSESPNVLCKDIQHTNGKKTQSNDRITDQTCSTIGRSLPPCRRLNDFSLSETPVRGVSEPAIRKRTLAFRGNTGYKRGASNISSQLMCSGKDAHWTSFYSEPLCNSRLNHLFLESIEETSGKRKRLIREPLQKIEMQHRIKIQQIKDTVDEVKLYFASLSRTIL